MDRFRRLSLLWIVAFVMPLASISAANEAPPFEESALEFFEKQVRPILVARCFECHSVDKKTPKGGLRLDSREGLLKGGDTGPAVDLDHPAASLLVSSINYGDIYQMPPKSKLPPEEIAILTKWVEMGLPWPKSAAVAGTVKPFDLVARAGEHWCWQPVKASDLPAVKQADWPAAAADRFILAALESRGLHPAPAADKRTLLRRVYFDLVGLPPTPEEVEQFAQDPDPRALEAIVDRLLNSVHFGERWGRHWLDLTRYAETRGHEFEPVIPNAWQFRDYVIRALNADVPFDRFLTEQLAGDLIEPRWRVAPPGAVPSALPINEALLGTGFWFLGEEVHSPVDIRKDETDRIDNRVDVLSKTFLGLTVGCARCHDHKFDAISQRDYYALAGFALSGSYRQVRIDTFEQHRQIAEQLDDKRRSARQIVAQELTDRAKPVLDQLELYFQAARQGLAAGISFADAAGDNEPIAPGAAILQRLADEHRLDAKLLARWCREWNLAKSDPAHPLHLLTAMDPAAPAAGTTPASTSPEAKEVIPGLVADFGDPDFVSPMQDGVSFGLRPVARGDLSLGVGTAGTSPLSVAKIGGWERDFFWKSLKLAGGMELDNGTLGAWQFSGRMVRSPEFILNKRHVWYLVRGSVRAYASVNSHLIVVGPLHGAVFREARHNDDQWHWVPHDLSLYGGHRMHIEFAPVDEAPCTIAMVVQSDEQPKFPDPSGNGLPWTALAGQSIKERTVAFAGAIRTAADSLRKTPPQAAPPQNAQAEVLPTVPSRWQQAQLAHWFVTHSSLFGLAEFQPSVTGLAETEAAFAKQVQWESTLAPAMLEGNGVNEFLLIRGNSNTPKEPVARRFLAAVESGDQPQGVFQSETVAGSGRQELAREMLRSPLVSRVAVNRIWHHLFGRGIVPTVDNLGVLGRAPSHPELLDYLATQFVQNGWSTKAMIRSLILSSTYQMSSHSTEADNVDPDNALWHRMPIKRLEGEAIRDSLLAVSGRLDRTPFGLSVPIHLTEFMQGRGRPGGSGPLDGNGRRSIYISVRRNFLSPMMLAFDTPSPFSTVGRRTVSNVPAQALILMNDPFVIEQANRWAEQVAADGPQTVEQRLDRMYLTAFARHPTPAEISAAMLFLQAQGVSQPDQQRAAWNNLCHVMFNLKEFVFVE